MFDIGGLLASIIQLVTMLIVVWCLLSWFPNINWYEQPFKGLNQIVRPIVAPFQRLIPPLGGSGIDFSPMIAILLLQALASFVRHVLP